MDVNGTRFHLLLGRADFETRCGLKSELASDEGTFSWDEKRNELTLGKRVFTFRSAPQNDVPRLDERRGAAVDEYGNVYWIDTNRTDIRVRSAGNGATSRFWTSNTPPPAQTSGLFGPVDPPEAAPLTLSGLAVTKEHYLAAGVIDPPGLLLFDLQSGGGPRQLLWPAGVEFAPFDIAAAPDGGVFVLDREHQSVWQLDRAFRVLPATGLAPASPTPPLFTPVDGDAGDVAQPPPLITSDLALHTALSDLVSIEVLRDGSTLLMRSISGAHFSTFHRYRDGLATGEPLDTSIAASVVDDPDDFTFLGHDFAYVAKRAGVNEATADVLYVGGGSGDQAIAFQLHFHDDGRVELEALRELHPMRLFSGKALVAAADDALYDLQDRWIPLVAQRRNAFARESEFTVVFDGKEPECTWHRLFLDACIPAGCGVTIYSRAANEKDLLPTADELPERALQQRRGGSELPWTKDVNTTWELLFQRPKGRYLQLRVVVRGNGRMSPHIRAMRVYYPRFSYLEHYLPDVYREDEASAWFLDRFLSLFEGFFTTIEERIAAAQVLFDVRSAPAETLEWLASWFAVALDPAWDERKRRLFLRHVNDFFAWRGTIPGLLMALRLVTEESPDDSIFDIATTARCSAVRIAERFRNRAIPLALLQPAAPASDGLPLRKRQAQWQPSQGAQDLDQRFAEFTGEENAVFRLANPGKQSDFARSTLGFVPRATSADVPLWQSYLARRYANIDDLNTAWGESYGSFADVPLPDRPPRAAAALTDWIRFEAVVLPARDAAHRFTVFLPQGTLGITDRQKRVDLATRIVALEKPAHTTFDVRFYWAWFRVGEARIGTDTVVDRGGSAPELFGPFVSDRSYIGSGYLTPEPARASRDRILLGAGCPRKGETP
jgi:phage tail-like protein